MIDDAREKVKELNFPGGSTDLLTGRWRAGGSCGEVRLPCAGEPFVLLSLWQSDALSSCAMVLGQPFVLYTEARLLTAHKRLAKRDD